MKEDQNNWEFRDKVSAMFKARSDGGGGLKEFVWTDFIDELDSWIKSNMVSKAEMRGWLEKERQRVIPKEFHGESPAHQHSMGYAEALSSVLSKLNEN